MTIDHYVGNYAAGFGAANMSMLRGNRGQDIEEKFATRQQQQ